MSSTTLTVKQAARFIGKLHEGNKPPHVSCIRRWIERGCRGRKLPAERIGQRFFIKSTDLIQFIQAKPADVQQDQHVKHTNLAVSALLGKSWGN